jgi:NitT/TauT family transport system ATP-binding protein
VATPHLVLDKVSVALGGRPILDGVSLAVAEREFVCVIGTSGGGKTTLLRCIAGLVPVASGSVSLGGSPVLAPTPRMAMVFQHFALFPWKTVRANVGYGLRVQGRSDPTGEVGRLLDTMHLRAVADRYPAQLSGGMRQRVGIARALAVQPEVLLLDEPFSSVDAITREHLQNEVLQLWEHRQTMTALLVTHDIDEAILMADRVVVISGPPGRVTAELAIELPRPRTSEAIRSHPDYARIRRQLWEAVERGGDSAGPRDDAAGRRGDVAEHGDDAAERHPVQLPEPA